MSDSWMAAAACADKAGLWARLLTSDDMGEALRAARVVCADCPVRLQCAEFGMGEMAAGHVGGIYGGVYIQRASKGARYHSLASQKPREKPRDVAVAS